MSDHVRKGSEIRYASPEALFMFGGEDRSAYYPPSLNEMRRWGVCDPYDRGAAAIERMQNLAFDHIKIAANLAIRDALATNITLKLTNAREIEKDRQRLAHEFNKILRL